MIDIAPGTHISAAAVALIGHANMAGHSVAAKFNGITLQANPGDSPERIVTAFGEESAAQAEAWRTSPEGQASAKKAADEIAMLQARADAMTVFLPTLDFTNHAVVIEYLAALQPCSDRIGVRVPGQEIVDAFATAGLVPNMCTGDQFDSENEDSFFRWLVGQDLAGLASGPAIHSIFLKFADDWHVKWGNHG